MLHVESLIDNLHSLAKEKTYFLSINLSNYNAIKNRPRNIDDQSNANVLDGRAHLLSLYN